MSYIFGSHFSYYVIWRFYFFFQLLFFRGVYFHFLFRSYAQMDLQWGFKTIIFAWFSHNLLCIVWRHILKFLFPSCHLNVTYNQQLRNTYERARYIYAKFANDPEKQSFGIISVKDEKRSIYSYLRKYHQYIILTWRTNRELSVAAAVCLC